MRSIVLSLLVCLPASAGNNRYANTRPVKQSQQIQTYRVYSLPPAIHYEHERQWLNYKRQYDEDLRRVEQNNLRSVTQRPIYTAPEPYHPPPPTGPPGRAEVTGFGETFAGIVKAFVRAKTKAEKGVFSVKDDRTGETLRLRFQHAHGERLHYHSSTQISGCVEFETIDTPKREVDLDFELTKDWDWEVSRIFVHSVNGRPRYAFDANDARVAIAETAAVKTAIPRPVAPAHLSASVRFAEASEDSEGALSVTVSNAGPGNAYRVRLTLDMRSAPEGVGLPGGTDFGDLPAGQSQTKVVPVSIAAGARGGKVQVVAAVVEANGFDTEPVLVELDIAPFASPTLELSAAAVEGGTVKPGETARLSVTIRNSGKARAFKAKASLRLGGGDLFMSGEPSVSLGDLGPGESKEAAFEFFVNRRVAAGAALPVFLTASDARGKHGFTDFALPLKMGQSAGALRVLSVANRAVEEEAPSVDQPPPAKTPQDPRAYAVVIGIEKYRDVAGVDYAARDAQSVFDYLTGSMGFKPENVALLKNERAGKADLSTYLGPWLADRTAGGKSRVFVYYSGHGTVDPKSGETFLVPYDGDPSYPETKGFALKELYASLGKMPGADAVVALDSCFSGSGGRSIMAQGIRPLLAIKSTVVPGNVVVLSASGGDQVSAANPKARHGLMTYHLLSGLGGAADSDRNGKITTLELYGYLGPAVEADARRQHIEQRPRLEPSPEAIGRRGERVWIVR